MPHIIIKPQSGSNIQIEQDTSKDKLLFSSSRPFQGLTYAIPKRVTKQEIESKLYNIMELANGRSQA